MGIFDWFGSGSRLRDRIIFTQKQRILSLEKETTELRVGVNKREDEIGKIRDSFEKAKERLVDQIIDLSDKFAGINQKMIDIAQENVQLKHLVEYRKDSKKEKKK